MHLCTPLNIVSTKTYFCPCANINHLTLFLSISKILLPRKSLLLRHALAQAKIIFISG